MGGATGMAAKAMATGLKVRGLGGISPQLLAQPPAQGSGVVD